MSQVDVAIIMVACLWAGFLLGRSKRKNDPLIEKIAAAALRCKADLKFIGTDRFASVCRADFNIGNDVFLIAVTPKLPGRELIVQQVEP
jgi:hypothetical protein